MNASVKIAAMQVNPLTKIIFLSAFLATGFLLIILSCALYGNWLPLIVVGIFLVAPIPNFLFSTYGDSYDFMNDSSNTAGKDFGHFLTGYFVISGLAIPIVFLHTHLITLEAAVMSMSGGLIVYLTIIIFGTFFHESSDDDYY